MSKRREEPFVVVDCATLPDTLIESELFGYEKGAFTGASERKPGRFELADQGTLFLDEVGNLSPLHQMKLLRAIQQYEISPLGSKRVKQVDIRIVGATNVRLKDAVAKGVFRADLYYRLSAVTIHIPPLRERQGDISLLAEHFLQMFNQKFHRHIAGIAPDVMHIFESYAWPGNVRELENAMRSAVLLADEEILPTHLPPYLQARGEEGEQLAPGEERIEISLRVPINLHQGVDLKAVSAAAAEAAERKLLTKIFHSTRLTQLELAKLLNVDPKTLRAKLRQFGLVGQESEE
jgi:transcriptional regulator with GAF, ATPase, and Fis domain